MQTGFEWIVGAVGETGRLKRNNAALLEACEAVFAEIEVELYESEPGSLWHDLATKLQSAIKQAKGT